MSELDTQAEGDTPSGKPDDAQQDPVGRADGESQTINDSQVIAGNRADHAADPLASPHVKPPEPTLGSREQPTMSVDWGGTGAIASLVTAAAKGFLDPQVVASFVNDRHDRDLERRESELRAERARTELELSRQVQDAELKRREAESQAAEARWRAERESDYARWRAEVEAESGLDRVRSLVLICVVLAVVATPILGMLREIDPEDFIQYITPITAITGTVLGYWFGRQESGLKRSTRDRFRVTENEEIKREPSTRSVQSPLV